MPYVITRSCCNDASCVPVCPVNCIHPTPDEPEYLTSEMLYIDPDACVECGACMDACPVSAIAPEYELPDSLAQFEQINADYFQIPEHTEYSQEPRPDKPRELDPPHTGSLRVAIVGSGPSACYAAEDLLDTRGLGEDVSVDMFERLAVPFGLVRFGVAPDHGDTKVVSDRFGALFRRKGFRLFLNTEIGRDLTHDDLMSRYHAVIYAVGAMNDRQLGAPGEDLRGSIGASEFVAWYNGHPDHADLDVDLDVRRAVVIGNGNVALDIARLLTVDHEVLGRTDIAEHALDRLGESQVEEVVVLARRGPLEAAFTTPELMGLLSARGIGVRIEGIDLDDYSSDDFTKNLKLSVLREAAESPAGTKTVVLRFLASPVEILGSDGHVTGLRIERTAPVVGEDGSTNYVPTGEVEEIDCGLVIRSIGFAGRPIEGLPFDERRGTVPNSDGRVSDTERTYVTGWIKRGPSGVIGTNKVCARQSVQSLIDDLRAGHFDAVGELKPIEDLPEELPGHLGAAGWKKIDRYERSAGRSQGRPRIKVVDHDLMVKVGRGDV